MKTDINYEPAHEEDIRQLMRQQLRDKISLETITAEEAEEEIDEYNGQQEDYDYLEESYDD